MSNDSSGGSTKSRLRRAFAPKTVEEAQSLASGYTIIVEPSEELGFVGSSLELPGVLADGKTRSACVDETLIALVEVVATMLENNDVPPRPLPCFDARTEQVNIRISGREKMAMKKVVSSFGYKGISDFMRRIVLEWISSH